MTIHLQSNSAPEITPEIIRWAEKKAHRYALHYGDPEDRFGSAVGLALVEALRTWRGDIPGAATFESQVRHMVVRRLNAELRQSGPLGYRRLSHAPGNHIGQPSVAQITEDHDRASSDGPVGWEVDYHDWVEVLARRLPAGESDAIRAMYLEAAGATIGRASVALGVSRVELSVVYARAIARLRAEFGSDWVAIPRARNRVVEADRDRLLREADRSASSGEMPTDIELGERTGLSAESVKRHVKAIGASWPLPRLRGRSPKSRKAVA